MITEEHRKQYQTEGYFVVDGMVPVAMFEELRAACWRVKKKVREGTVDVYTHWAATSEPWCIRGLIASEFDEPILPNTCFINRLWIAPGLS